MLDFRSQFKDVVRTTLPISTLMLLLDLLILSPTAEQFILTLICYGFIIVGFTLFLYDVDIGILPMGSAIGSEIPKRNSVFVAIGIVFLIGVVVTMAEPDVSVFSNMVNQLYPEIDGFLLTMVIALGVGSFVVVATLKIVLKVPIRIILTAGYAIILALSFFAPEQYLGIVFDSGGVTTGPMTIPILMSIGIGICATISSKGGMEKFGMIGGIHRSAYHSHSLRHPAGRTGTRYGRAYGQHRDRSGQLDLELRLPYGRGPSCRDPVIFHLHTDAEIHPALHLEGFQDHDHRAVLCGIRDDRLPGRHLFGVHAPGQHHGIAYDS